MRRIDVTERRARLGVRHRLAVAARADGPAEVAHDLVALHSTDPSSVYVAIWARANGGSVRDVELALYEDRTLIRLLGMRRTVFVTTLDVAPVLQAACSDAVAARERRKLLGFLAASEVADDEEGVRAWLAETEDIAVRALAARGESTAAELAGDDARLSTKVVLSAGKDYEGTQKVASRLLLLLAAEGRAVRGRPRGSWTSHQYRWAPLTYWFPGGLAHWDTHRAEEELARRWLRAFGPATADDLRWWAGWTKTQVKRVLTEVKPVEVDLGGGTTGLLLPDDLEETAPPEPWAALLPALDSTPMGWHEEAGSSASTVRASSTGPGTSALRSGGTAVSSGAGRRTGAVRSSAASWRTSAPTRGRRYGARRSAWPYLWARSGSAPAPAAAPGWRTNWRSETGRPPPCRRRPVRTRRSAASRVRARHRADPVVEVRRHQHQGSRGAQFGRSRQQLPEQRLHLLLREERAQAVVRPPPPYPTCGLGLRVMSKRSGSVKTDSSRLAEA